MDNSKNQMSAIDPHGPEIGGLLLCADCLTRARDLADWLDQHPPK